ncbi:MAG: hypothetical protein QNJ45_13405 [Ardenticatenaceae bacterium]|nr:hypothetical protein [Ardenticatenaceae bacterium]
MAVEYPFGQIVGRPGDTEVQRAVLKETLEALETITEPGKIKHLPFEWPGTLREARAHPAEPPPIVGYLRRHPWQLPKLLSRKVPQT